LTEPALDLQLDAAGAQPPLAGMKRDAQHAAGQADSFAPLGGEPPLWLLDPPPPVGILTPRKHGRRVLSLPFIGATRSPATPGEQHSAAFAAAWAGGARQLRITRYGGPWKLVDPATLTEREPLARDCYQLEVEEGRACLVYRDRITEAWFLQAIFD
jgi:hypothetical protein